MYLAILEIKKFGNYVYVESLNTYVQTKGTNRKSPTKNIEMDF